MDIDKAEKYIQLTKIRWNQLNVRRGIQWKINFSFWSVLAILIGFGLKGEVTNTSINNYVLIIGHVALLILYVYYCWGSLEANTSDAQIATEYQNRAELALGVSPDEFVDKKLYKMNKLKRYWAKSFELGITVILLSFSLNILICGKS